LRCDGQTQRYYDFSVRDISANMSRRFPFAFRLKRGRARACDTRHKFAKLFFRVKQHVTTIARCTLRKAYARLLALSHYQSTDCRCRRRRRRRRRRCGWRGAVTYRPRARYHFSNALELFFHDVDWWRRRVRI